MKNPVQIGLINKINIGYIYTCCIWTISGHIYNDYYWTVVNYPTAKLFRTT